MISYKVRKIIQSIKEIVGEHSEADVYAVLKDSNMDPNETAQKLLNQDPFHEVKRKRDKKKELTGYRALSDTRRHVENNVQPAKSQTWDRNGRRGGYTRNSVPGVSREFRIVRDNRVNQNANRDVKPESVQNSASGKEQMNADPPEKSVARTLDQKQSALSSSEGSLGSHSIDKPCNSALDGPGHKEDVGQGQGGTVGPSRLEKAAATAAITNPQTHRVVKDNSKSHSASTSTNSVIGVYSSSLDPVHVPSSASRSAGTVGAIRREVGVVGVRKQSPNHPASNSSVPNSSLSGSLLGKDVSSSSGSLGQPAASSKSSQLNQPAASEPTVPSMFSSRSSSVSQYNTKIHQQPMGYQKAMQSTMEWKPKSSQKPANISPSMSGTASAATSSHNDNSSTPNPVDVTNLSEKVSQVNIVEERHVIIPQHLRVPEFERTQLTFGSFGAGFDSTKASSSVSQTFENAEQSIDGPSISLPASVPIEPSGNSSADERGDLSDHQSTSQSDSSASASESEQAAPGNSERLTQQNAENYSDIGLVQSRNPPYASSHMHQLQSPANLPNFSEYDSQKSYNDLPFLRTVIEDNPRAQGLASTSEAVSSHVASSSPASTVALSQQHPLQQQPLANMYPQMHIPHFPNFIPYRHMISPFYVPPPMAMPNYSSNPAYPHPSNGSSYLLMPGGSSPITAGGMKYAPSQYKPVPAGSPTAYGNYTNPTGFAITNPGTVGGANGLEDATRIKYKDNNLYVPNPQAETSDIWIQTQRELPSMQSAPYYNLGGQAPHPAAAAFIPAAHAGHSSFNAAAAAAAQSSHMQYPGLYHPPASPAPIAGPHHLVHQPGLGGNISGVGLAGAAPGPQVGAYQQPQLSHLNWPASF